MTKPSQDLTKTISQLLNEAQLAQNKLEHTQIELAQLQKQRDSLEHDIEAETARLQAKQQDTLSAYKKRATKSLETIEKQVAAANSVFEEQVTALEAQREEAIQLQEIIAKGNESAAKAAELIKIAGNDLIQVRGYCFSKQQDHDTLTSAVNALQDTLTELKNDVDIAKSDKDLHEQAVAHQKAVVEELQDQADKLKVVLESTEAATLAAKQEYKQYVQSTETLRTELATRQLALDDREQVLKSREYKVSMKEGIALHNDQLMSL